MVTILFEAIADAWVEDSDILLGCSVIPEWILSRQSSGALTTSTNGHPWAAHQDDDIAIDAENSLNAWS